MFAYMAIRRARYFSTATSASVDKPMNISQVKKKLKSVFDPDEALKIYSSFTGASDSTSPAYARHAQEATVRRLAKSRRFSDIETLLESHKSRPQIAHEPFLSSLIRSYGVAGMFENALNTYNQMTDLGTPRSSFSFNALLAACNHCKMFDRVPVYFNEFPEKFGFEPDSVSYGILIKAYCEMGSLPTALEKMNEMVEKGIEGGAVAFTTILHALYKNGKTRDAEKFWDEMVNKKGYKVDVGAYNVRLAQIHGGKPETVKSFIEEMENAVIKPDSITYNYLITCYCLNDMMDEADKVYVDLLKAKGNRPNSATYRTMVFHSCKNGRYVRAYKIFKDSVEAGKIPDFNTLQYLVRGLAKGGQRGEDAAKAMIRTMNKKFPPELLKVWGKLEEELGLAPANKEGVKSDEREEEVGSDVEAEKE